MSLQATNLVIQAAQLPATFKGQPNDMLIEMVRRMRIVSPSGVNFLFIGDSEPTSNVGPWLKGGTQWWVWNEATKRYVPLDVSASVTVPFKIGNSIPADSNPPVWLQTTTDATDQNPQGFGDPIGWYVFDGSVWVPFNSIPLSGNTAGRPAAPVNYQQYYDTDISCLIWWERGAWRTVSGVPGDVKQVVYTVLTDALAHNPGWQVLGDQNTTIRGRSLVQASKDPGVSPETDLPVAPGVPSRAAFATGGENDTILLNQTNPGPPVSQTSYPPYLALWTLYKL